MADAPLAIVTPRLDNPSETFIRRHVEALLPARSVTVVGHQPAATRQGGDDERALYTSNRAAVPITARLLDLAGRTLRGLPPGAARVTRFLRHHRTRVVLGEYLDFSAPYLTLARRLGLRFFAHAHGYDVSERRLADPSWQRIYRRYRHADGIITVSAVARRRLLALGLPPAHVHVVPCGTDVPAAPPVRTVRGEVRCLAVGRMVAKKGPILTLDAFRRAHELCPALRLDYVGDGPLLPAVRQYVRAFDLGSAVTVHGLLPHATVLGMRAQADVFLQHSLTDEDTGDQEGLPVAIVEAMAAALPVLSTWHAGIPEAVLHAVTGLLVAEGDARGMAAHLVRLATDPALRQRLGRAGWARAWDRFSWERERRTLLRLLAPGWAS